MNKVRLSNIAHIKMGQSPEGRTCNEQGIGMPLLNGPSEFTEFYPIPMQFTVDAKRVCKEGEILFCVRGSTTGRMNWSNREYALGRGLASISHKAGQDLNHFLKYIIQLNLKSLLNTTSGSTFPNLTNEMLSSFEISVPMLQVQKQISTFLKLIDSKIELNNHINAEIEAMAKTIYDYWFVQFDFPNHEGKPYKSSGGKMVWNKELNGNIPEGWKASTIAKWILKDKSGDWGKDSLEGNYTERVSCIRGADINGLNGKGNCNPPERFILKKNDNKLLNSHDLIVEISGGSPTQSTGRLAYLIDETLNRFENPLICSNFCKAIELKETKLLFNFVFNWNRLYDNGVLFGYEGKTSGIKNFLFDSFINSYWVAIPPQELVDKFYKLMLNIEKKKQTALKENQHLASLRDWLLPMLMNGQVRVNPLVNESTLSVAAEPQGEYKKQSRTIPVDAHILAGHIVQRLCKTKGMGRTKLQKALHLIEYHCRMELNSQSMQFAAGPHDQEMMNHIDQKFKQYQHVKKEKEFINGKPHFNYTPTNKIQEIESAYGNIESQKRKEIDDLLDKIASMDLARAEIVSTLYAVWNNRLIANQDISDECLLSDFYNWSEHKHDFPKELVLKALNYMRNEGIVPVGWGKYIDKRE